MASETQTTISANAGVRPFALPSLVVSLVLHTTLLVLVATRFQSCQRGLAGVGAEEFRQVGIYVQPENDLSDTRQATAEETQVSESQEARFDKPAAPNPPQDNAIADLIDLPPVESPRLGPGWAPPATAASHVGDLMQPNRVGRASAFAPQRGATSFFNIEDKGKRFVYVLDRSGSMGDRYGAIFIAKEELRSSLAALDATQLFQIVFYSTDVVALRVGSGKPKMYPATEVNRTMARQFINGIEPEGGTSHMPALEAALKFDPEVIFFLTDAKEPQLSAADLNDIRKLNRNRATIHCVEFGNGPELSVDSFLKKLARQNEGMYRYRDVTKFRRK